MDAEGTADEGRGPAGPVRYEGGACDVRGWEDWPSSWRPAWSELPCFSSPGGRPGPGSDELEQARQLDEAGGRAAALREVCEKFPGQPAALTAARLLLLGRREGPADEARAAADRYVRAAAEYGPEMELEALYR